MLVKTPLLTVSDGVYVLTYDDQTGVVLSMAAEGASVKTQNAVITKAGDSDERLALDRESGSMSVKTLVLVPIEHKKQTYWDLPEGRSIEFR